MPWVDGHGFSHDHTDVFISGSHRVDEKLVIAVGQRLVDEGFLVFHTRFGFAPGESYQRIIEHHLRVADSILVCWSPDAAESEFVKAEAEYARTNGKLVSCKIAPCELMPPFNLFQTLDLSDWAGNKDDKRWLQLIELLRHRKSKTIAPFAHYKLAPSSSSRNSSNSHGYWLSFAGLVIALLSGFAGWLLKSIM